MTESAAAERPASAPTGRRGLLGAGLAGAAIALSASRGVAAGGVSDNDAKLLGAALGLELTARDLYDEAIAAGAGDMWYTIREMHESFAHVIAGLIGESADTHNAGVFDQLKESFAASDPSPAAIDLEHAAAATHIGLLAKLDGKDSVAMVASIAASESRLATVITAESGNIKLDALLLNPADPIDLGASS